MIFKSNLVHSLRSAIHINLDKYHLDNVWVSEVFARSERDIPTGVEPLECLFLDSPKDGQLNDIENAIRLHKALRNLTPLQATDPRLWTRLTHVEFWT